MAALAATRARAAAAAAHCGGVVTGVVEAVDRWQRQCGADQPLLRGFLQQVTRGGLSGTLLISAPVTQAWQRAYVFLSF